jgi:hypothetical protein
MNGGSRITGSVTFYSLIEKGIIIHPKNNINSFTDPLAENRFAFYHSVTDDRPELVAVQKAWLRKLVEVTADLDKAKQEF